VFNHDYIPFQIKKEPKCTFQNLIIDHYKFSLLTENVIIAIKDTYRHNVSKEEFLLPVFLFQKRSRISHKNVIFIY